MEEIVQNNFSEDNAMFNNSISTIQYSSNTLLSQITEAIDLFSKQLKEELSNVDTILEQETNNIIDVKTSLFTLESETNLKLESVQNEISILQGEIVSITDKIQAVSNDNSNDEVVMIDVGTGILIPAKRSTLCQVEGTLLSQMFSPDSEFKVLPRESDGAIYLEYDGELFSTIISYLKTRIIKPDISVPTFNGWKQECFEAMMETLGLGHLMPEDTIQIDSMSNETPIDFQYGEEVRGDRNLKLLEQENFVQCNPMNMTRTSFLCKGDSTHNAGITIWRFERRSTKDQFFIGVISNNQCTGWGFTKSNIIAITPDGKSLIKEDAYEPSEYGAIVSLTLDNELNNVSIVFRNFTNVLTTTSKNYNICLTVHQDINLLYTIKSTKAKEDVMF